MQQGGNNTPVPTVALWKPHIKYPYGLLSKKEEELSTEEKKSLLSHPPLVLPEKVKQYLDAEASWHKHRVDYLGKMKATKALQTMRIMKGKKGEDEPMKELEVTYESKRQKRKRAKSANAGEEPKAKRVKVSNTAADLETEEVTEEQWGRLTDELETRHKMNLVLIDEIGDRVDKAMEPTYAIVLKRTHTSTYEDQITASTLKQVSEWMKKHEAEKDEKKLEGLENEIKQEKKQLRQVVIAQNKLMGPLEQDVINWLSTTEAKEFELEDGKLFLFKQQQNTKLTRQVIRQATIDCVSTKGTLAHAKTVVNLMNKLLAS
jgi:hypothetical protein